MNNNKKVKKDWQSIGAGYVAGLLDLAVKTEMKVSGSDYNTALATVAHKQPELITTHQNAMTERGSHE